MDVPFAVARLLPEDLPPASVEACLSVCGSLSETHLVLGGDRFLAFSRISVLAEMETIELDPSAAPAIRRVGWDDVLQITGTDGAIHDVAMPSVDRERFLGELAVLYRALGAWGALRDALERALASTFREDEQRVIRLALADACVRDGDDVAAVGHYEVVAASGRAADEVRAGLEPMFEAGRERGRAGAALDALYRRIGDWPAVARLAEARLESRADADAWLEIAELYESRLRAPEGAMRALARALAVRFDDAVLDRLDSLARRGQSWPVFATLLDDIAVSEGAPRAAIALRAADVRAQHIGDVEAAENGYREALATADEPAIAERARAALRALYASLGRWTDAAELAEAELAEATDIARRVALARELARIYDVELDDSDGAVIAYEQVLDVASFDDGAFEALDRLHRRRDDAAALFGVLERRLKIAVDISARVAFTGEMAALAAGPLQQPSEAIRLWLRVRQLDPAHDGAARALETLFFDAERWSELAHLLQAERDRAQNADIRAEINRQLAGLYEGPIDQPDEAIRAWRSVLDDRLDDREALERLAALHEMRSEHGALADALRRLLAIAGPDAPGLVQWEVTLATTLGDHLGLDAEATAIWEGVLRAVPKHARAVDALVPLYFAADRLADALPLLEVQKETGGETVDLWRSFARIYDGLGDEVRARFAHEQVLEGAPDDADAFARLEALYRSAAQWSDLLALYDKRLKYVVDVPGRLELITRAAVTAERHAQAPEMALALLLDSLDVFWSRGPYVSRVVRLAAETGTGQRLLGRLRQLEESAEPEAATPLAKIAEAAVGELGQRVEGEPEMTAPIARWYADRGDDERAVRWYQRAIDAVPSSIAAWLAIRQILTHRGQWTALIAHLDAMAAQSAFGRDVRLGALMTRATIMREHLQDETGAAETLARARKLRRTGSRAIGLLFGLALVIAAWMVIARLSR